MVLDMTNYYHLSRCLDTNGNQTGTTAVTGDYSVTPEEFFIQPPSDRIYYITRMLVGIRDTGNFSASIYGAGSALTNGIKVQLKNDDGTWDILDPNLPVTTNAQWGYHCYDASYQSYGVGDNFLLVRWTFQRMGAWVELKGDNNDRLVVLANDDFTGLNEHYFTVQGLSATNSLLET